ncbi:MAG: hypothetical protein R2737_14995 [Candidatus Nanopelagicales bacterium]
MAEDPAIRRWVLPLLADARDLTSHSDELHRLRPRLPEALADELDRRRAGLARMLDVWPGCRVLDLSGDLGATARSLAERGGQVTAVRSSEAEGAAVSARCTGLDVTVARSLPELQADLIVARVGDGDEPPGVAEWALGTGSAAVAVFGGGSPGSGSAVRLSTALASSGRRVSVLSVWPDPILAQAVGDQTALTPPGLARLLRRAGLPPLTAPGGWLIVAERDPSNTVWPPARRGAAVTLRRASSLATVTEVADGPLPWRTSWLVPDGVHTAPSLGVEVRLPGPEPDLDWSVGDRLIQPGSGPGADESKARALGVWRTHATSVEADEAGDLSPLRLYETEGRLVAADQEVVVEGGRDAAMARACVEMALAGFDGDSALGAEAAEFLAAAVGLTGEWLGPAVDRWAEVIAFLETGEGEGSRFELAVTASRLLAEARLVGPSEDGQPRGVGVERLLDQAARSLLAAEDRAVMAGSEAEATAFEREVLLAAARHDRLANQQLAELLAAENATRLAVEEQLRASRERAADLARMLEEVFASRSWRVTAPLRRGRSWGRERS